MPLVSREAAEASIPHVFADLYATHSDDNAALRLRRSIRSHEFDYDGRTLALEFPIEDWMTNSQHALHGGMLAMCADLTCGALARILYGLYPPAVMLSVSFLRASFCGDSILVRAHATHLGRNNANVVAEVYSKNTGALLATATDINFVGGASLGAARGEPPESQTAR